MILGFYAGKSHNLIGLGIFHGDLDSFDLHEKSRNLSNYEIFPHKILKSRTFKKSSILIVINESNESEHNNLTCALVNPSGLSDYGFLRVRNHEGYAYSFAICSVDKAKIKG